MSHIFYWMVFHKSEKQTSTRQNMFVLTSGYLALRPEMLLVIAIGTNLDKPV